MSLKLFLVVIGCKPAGRHTEQHDVFFGVGASLKELLPAMHEFWPGAKLHIDSWREVNVVNGHRVKVVSKEANIAGGQKLFFINLGGYKPGDLEEYHYKYLAVAEEKGAAIQASRKTAFYKHTGFKGATSHVDDKYGIDVDDVYEIDDVLPAGLKNEIAILVEKTTDTLVEDELHIGYVKLSNL
ncbi:MAG: DUF1543 domain-containing protein [Gloeobacteraceae cyanobacterium ES-bin-316]|nr:DUF1543 domain-containing protein [Ferruginibacter sp.]